MTRRPRIAGYLILASLLFAAVSMRSEGPLVVGGPAPPPPPPVSSGTVEGAPYAWTSTSLAFDSSTKTLKYWTDQGGLGRITNPAPDTLVATALSAWSNVSTANINFPVTPTGHLGVDVTGSNVLPVDNAVNDCTTLPGPPAGGIAQPVTIMYDADGSIIRYFGADPGSTLGMATALCPTSDGIHNTYNRGEAILNGSSNLSATALTSVMRHEFGHMLGLDHSQINLDCLNNTSSCKVDGSIAGVPLMFPVLLQDNEVPNTDDMAGISALYPVTGTPATGKTLLNTLGEIQGQVLFTDGVTPAQGFNVIARSVANPRTVAVSNLSGYLFTEEVANGAIPSSSQFADPFFSRNPAVIGYFDIPGLPPGDYTVEVEAVNNSGYYAFVYGSSIGPIGSWLGFQFPLPGSCGSRQFYDTTSGTDPCTSTNATPITVPAASTQVVTGINISFIGTGPRYDSWEDGP
jgi:Matrixin